MTKRLNGKVAIITGAGSGIGRASALLFAAHGATVIVNDVHADTAHATVDAIVAAGGAAAAFPADVTDCERVQALVRFAVERHGRLDILFNNAGGSPALPTHAMTPQQYRAIIALNLDAVVYGILAALPVMRAQRKGCMLTTTSGAGLRAVPQLAAYGAAKAGVISLARNIAVEYGAEGIRANVIAPGPMDTPGLRYWLNQQSCDAEQYGAQVPSGRLGTAEDIAGAALFLVSDEAEFINGAVLPVDGAVQAKLASPRTTI